MMLTQRWPVWFVFSQGFCKVLASVMRINVDHNDEGRGREGKHIGEIREKIDHQIKLTLIFRVVVICEL